MKKQSLKQLRAIMPQNPGMVAAILEKRIPKSDQEPDAEDRRDMKAGKYNAREEALEEAKEKKTKKAPKKVGKKAAKKGLALQKFIKARQGSKKK